MNVHESYHELGLKPDSTDAEVKAAWRRLAARWHPDRNSSPHALRKIQRINRALKEIRDSRSGSLDGLDGLDEEEAASTEPPVEHVVDISLEEVAAGCTRELQGELVEDCAACTGSGLQPHTSACGECAGTCLLYTSPSPRD